MPIYQYKALSQAGKNLNGTVDAPDEKEAARLLRSRNLFIISIEPQIQLPWARFIKPKVPLKERIVFTRQLAVMIRAGLPLVQALSALAEQSENTTLKRVLLVIAQDIKGGSALSKSLTKYPAIFPPIYVSIVASGEKSGKLEEVLQNMADQLEKDYDLISAIRGAMIYPIIVLVALLGVILLIIFFIMPQLNTVFADMGAELPLTTKIVLSLSNIVRQFFLIVVAAIILAILAVRYWTRTASGKFIWDSLKLRLPIFGSLAQKIYMARFSRTMAMLISAGLPMLEAIDTVTDVINNSVYKRSLAHASNEVENGVPLSKVLGEDGHFPPMVVHLLSTGEQSGNVEYVLSEMADFFDKEATRTTRNLSSLIEPLLMVIMGIGVGFVVAAVLSPIYNLVNQI